VAPDRPLRVLLIGFGEFERHALSTFIRLSAHRVPAYEQVDAMDAADFIIADTDHPGAIDDVVRAERGADTVYIGSVSPDGALAWAMRPIDPMQVFRELDGAVAMRMFKHAPPPPLHVASAPAPLADDKQPLRRATDVAAAPLALLVDDSEIALRYLQRQLDALGFRTDTCTDSQGALAKLAQQRFDAVFVDLDLGPDSAMNGFSLCQHVKRQRAQGTGLPPRVVIVSAHGSATDRVRGTFVGCDAYLTKPLNDTLLAEQLRTLGLLASNEPERPRRSRSTPREPVVETVPTAPVDSAGS
jgi:twitching motility two-component system response regulator PilG